MILSATSVDTCTKRCDNDGRMPTKRPNSSYGVNEALRHVAGNISTGNAHEALRICRNAIAQFPTEARLYYGLGIALSQAGSPAEAVAAYHNALRLQPAFFEALVNLGAVLSGLGRLPEAVQSLRQATQLHPDVAEVYVNLSNALRENWELDEAIAAGKKSLQIKPGLAVASICLGAALACRGDFDQAITVYRDAIKIRPDFPAAHLNLGLVLLVTGNFAEGWAEYEWRRRCAAAMQPRKFSQPAWMGENLTGKTILLHAEQGFGDAIHFIRYVPMVVEKGGKTILECQPGLVRLFQQIPGIQRVIPAGQAAEPFDVHCALPSLGGVFNTDLDSIPATIPYLAAAPSAVQSWAKRLARSGQRIEIGLAWAGSAENRNDRNRSISLAKFTPLVSSERFRLHSLAVAPPPGDSGVPIVDWSADLKDFAETAALISNLDLVISVDTAVAHLAAAMGKKVWLLLPFPPDWRWMLDRTDSPWYPTVRLFRQQTPGDWDAVIRRLPMRELAQS